MENLTKILFQSILNNLIKIEEAGDHLIDPDFSIELMESTASLLQTLNDKEIKILIGILENLVNKKNYVNHKDYLQSFTENFGLNVPDKNY